jgi:AraC-like DNA-binding protein
MTIDISIINTLGITLSILLILFSAFLLTVNSSIKAANRYFAIFLLLVCFDVSGLYMYQWLIEHPWIDALRRGSVYLQMPFLLFYVRSTCFKESRLSSLSVLHFGLFLFFIGTLFYHFTGLSHQQVQVFLQNANQTEFLFFHILGELQFVVYVYLMYSILRSYKQLYSDHFSAYEKSAYRWLVQLILLLVIAHVIASSKAFMVFTASPQTISLMYMIVSCSALLFVCWIVFKALHHPSISRGPIDLSLIETKNESSSGEDASQELGTLMRQIDLIMQERKPFLDPDLTLQQLAELANIDKKTLSNVLNKGFRENFFNYVNKKRVEYAKMLLTTSVDKTILEIIYDVGFNSKSSFNTAFKKHAGLTPSAFRSKHVA